MFKLLSPKKILFCFALSVCTLIAKAQFGGNPPAINWRQINTPAARIIFPNGLDSVGLRVASIIAQMNGAVKPTIGNKQRQVNILLQNQTIISNGFVMLAPFKSEFYLTPDQNSFELGSLSWNEQLAIHEFRHVQQYNNFNVGLSRFLHILFGESGQALGNEIAIPDWFFEGDAVFNETHVSEQGRGRLPYFFNGFHGLWDAGKDYSWMKLRNGSYKDYVPDWYPLGYMMNAYGREKYGPMFWRNVTHDAAAYKSLFYPFEHGVQKYSGVSYTRFRNDALGYFKQQIATPVDKVVGPKYKKSQHFIADIEYPAVVNDSTVIYVKSSYKKIPAFVIRTGNREKQIAVKDLSLDRYFNYHNGKIVYASYRPDLRWGYRNYNELKVIDVVTGEQKRITSRSKYFSPAFSDDGKSIVAVQVDPSGQSKLLILDTETGKLMNEIHSKTGIFYTYPKFFGTDKIIAAVRNTKGKMTIASVDIKTGSMENLLAYNIAPVGFTAVQKDTIYFTATTGVNDRLYALSVTDKKLYRLQSDTLQYGIGNYEPSVAGNKLAWVSFSAYGYQLHQADKQSLQRQPVDVPSPGSLSEYKITALKKDSAANLLAAVETQPFKVSKYNKLHNLFNFHSILPDFEDPNYTLSLAGQNVLNTFQSALSGTYNRNEGYKQIGYNAVYGAWFPYVSAGADYTFDRKGYYRGQSIYWNEAQIHAGASVPFNFSSGQHSTYLSIGSSAYYNTVNFQSAYRSLFKDQNFVYLSNSISFSNSMQQAVQQIYPHLAQAVTLNFKKGVINADNFQFLATGNFYFPGLVNSHSFVVALAHQQRSENTVIDFSNDFPFSRGYTVYNLYKMDKVGVNYHFPIAYPDAGFANLIYILRMRGNLFFDYTKGKDFYTNGSVFKGDFRSTGMEVFFDTQWFNQAPITFGIRYTHLLDQDLGSHGSNRIELVVPLTIF
ncbi:TolB family protein [Mucilaginibacter polytrichastri]|uniref:Uncharacterized protein n=1 Tax=Mucilaginibacter polytrichastri TaxID=1302689 RepID=A0A1Q5ZZB9_9SPHI|nr:hypothetical protein [Mucilaginibacter polytrichastri]OKS87101.1 hypothetical protein RG47T_2560 [Mucilaginibacter polytrichastri]SFS87470.1 hypothetical protein SAMN04487890_105170 [Mucilaginibacter polytrichastri]